jgi:organic radical activating enzyme
MSIEPKVTIRIIRRCNFDCPGCSTFSTLNRKGTMRYADFRKVIDILKLKGFQGTLNISGGEPTLHKRLSAMIHYASMNLPEAQIAVFTNGDWIGARRWRQKLRRLAGGDNTRIRFSHDLQHAHGSILAAGNSVNSSNLTLSERERMAKAKRFKKACLEDRIKFDFAFKGSITKARSYLRELGEVPVYLIRFQKEPDRRPKKFGFFAVDVQEDNSVRVYATLGHIPAGQALGGIEALPPALEMNRKSIRYRNKT